jgi:hypothetical protein
MHYINIAKLLPKTPLKFATNLALGLLVNFSVSAQDFDKSLLPGLWAESVNTQPACESDNLHFRFELSEEGKILGFKLDRMWQVANGKSVDKYSAKVLEVTNRTMVIEYIDLDGLPEGYPKAWELAFVSPGVYRWRATVWTEGEVNPVVGIRCTE